MIGFTPERLIGFTGIRTAAENERHRLEIASVRVNLRPDVLLTDGAGRTVGGIKFSFNKSPPLSRVAAEFVATLLRFYFGTQAPVRREFCYSIVVSAGLVVTAPISYKKRLKDLSAACDEIAARWSHQQAAA